MAVLHTFTVDRLVPDRDNYSDARTLEVEIVPSVTLAKGTVVGQVTATGKFKAYASGNSDGSEVPKGVMEYTVTSDANGLITKGTAGTGEENGTKERTASMFCSGVFRTQELVGLDANALGKVGRLIYGSTSNGLIKLA